MRSRSAFLLEPLLRESLQWITWLPVWFGAGILCYFLFPFEPYLTYSLMACGICLCLAIYTYWRQFFGFYWLSLLFMFLSLGLVTAQFRTLSVSAPKLTKNLDPVLVKGTIFAIDRTPTAQRVTLSHVVIDTFSPTETPLYVRLNNIHHIESLHVGDRVNAKVILKPPMKPLLPGGFSFAKDAYFKQIGAIGFALGPLQLTEAADTISVMGAISHLRQRLTAIFFNSMTPSSAALANALLIGDQGAIAKVDFEAMRESGLAHLLSVSGMHLTQVAAILFFSCRLLLAFSSYITLHYSIKRWAAIFAIMGSLFYLILTNMPTPAVRAFIMTFLVLFALIIDRDPTPIRSIAFAAFVILLFLPESLLSASFQMSFAAVLALVSCFEYSAKYIPKPIHKSSFIYKIIHYVVLLTFSSLIAGLATAPFTMYHFHQFSTVSILANLIAIPLSSFIIMPLGIISLVAIALHIPTIPLYLLDISIQWLLRWSHYIASLPYASIHAVNITGITLLLFCLGLLWVCLWQTSLRWYGLLLFVISIGSYFIPRTWPDIIIDEKGEIFAFQNSKKQLVFSNTFLPKYLRTHWQSANQTNPDTPTSMNINDPLFSCDAYGCLYVKNGKTVAISTHPFALKQDCRKADAVVNLTHIHFYCEKIILDRWRLLKNGTYTITLDENLHIDHAINNYHLRPWQ